MKIAVIGWLKGKPHPCQGYGGIEKSVAVVCAELVRQGHEVTLIAPAGSFVEGAEIIETCDMVEAANICNSLNVDVVHDNTCWDLQSPVRQGIRHPHISVTHVNHAIDYTKNVVYLSKSQRTQHGLQVGRDLNQSPVVYVPINPALKPKGLPRKDYLLFLGMVGEHKGVLESAQVAAYLGRKLIVAGPAWGEYADKVLAHPSVEYVGEVSDPYRSELIEQAYAMCCLHQPINGWQEPGCGVFGEAMAFGTPVAAFRNGCLPELVRGGLNGWIADTVDDIATFMDHDEYPSGMKSDRIAYSAENVVRLYVHLYQQIINGYSWG